MKSKPGLPQKEYNKIAGQVQRRTPLNGALVGKLKKVATNEQLAQLMAIETKFGESLPFCPAISALRKIKIDS